MSDEVTFYSERSEKDTELFNEIRKDVELVFTRYFERCTSDEERDEFHRTVTELGKFIIDSHEQ